MSEEFTGFTKGQIEQAQRLSQRVRDLGVSEAGKLWGYTYRCSIHGDLACSCSPPLPAIAKAGKAQGKGATSNG